MKTVVIKQVKLKLMLQFHYRFMKKIKNNIHGNMAINLYLSYNK